MQDRDLVYHGLAIKRHATTSAVAQLLGLPEDRVAAVLSAAAATQRAVRVDGAYALTPLARVAIEARYGSHFSQLRGNREFVAAYDSFEGINRQLKRLITDWQMIEIGGRPVPNDHRDQRYDSAILDRLGRLHESMAPVFAKFAAALPRLRLYEARLLRALELAEDGDISWVSDVQKASYHTVWFELHEDLLRILSKVREE